MIQITEDSHLDHGLTTDQVAHIVKLFAKRNGFFMETFELPPELGTVMCSLRGPVMGDAPVSEIEVEYRVRGTRPYLSRMHAMPPRPTNTVSVIAGPHNGLSCVLYTAFGGPIAPKEVGEIAEGLAEHNALPVIGLSNEAAAERARKFAKLTAELDESKKFWTHHALGDL